ncbi:MAG: hypothetical protein ACK6CT_07335 [Planctomycetia bacterium]
MSSAIDPLPNANPGAEPRPAGKPAAKPAAGQPPVPARVPLTKPPVAAVRGADAAADSEQPEEGGFVDTSAMVKQAPAWAVSMLVHIVLLLMLALIVNKPDEKPKPREIVSVGPESDQPLEEFTNDAPPNPAQDLETTTEVSTTDVVIPTVVVASDASDLEAAPLALELSDFGDTTAPASDVLSSIGAAGGTSTGFGGRKNPGKAAAGGGGGADTEAAVDAALKWLAEHQLPDGSWSFRLEKECPSCMGKCSGSGKTDNKYGATAMALLPFLGRGYTHQEGPYKKEVGKGLKVLAEGALTGKGRLTGDDIMYVQGLAGIALCEAFGMTQDEQLRAPAQYVLDYNSEAQDPVGGGWRYGPKQPGDTSVVGWHLMALKSGHMAYLNVQPQTIRKVSEFLDGVSEDSGAAYGYISPGRGLSTTAIGLLCRMYLGWKKDHPALQRGVVALAQRGPSQDLYYSYYATQVVHHFEGDAWRSWNNSMKSLLLPAQAKTGHEAGSWFQGVNAGHGRSHGGRLYCTSLATLMLEVYYRHAPLYGNQAVDNEFRE